MKGFGYDPNYNGSSSSEFDVTAALCEWDMATESYVGGYAACTEQEIANSQAGFVDFSYTSTTLTTSSTWWALDVRAGSGAAMKVVTMPFKVRPKQAAARPVANPVIKVVESPSVGVTEVNTTSFTGTFPDDGIFVEISGEDSTNPNGGGLVYEWEAAFVQTTAEKKIILPHNYF